jgi:hypothetical protein
VVESGLCADLSFDTDSEFQAWLARDGQFMDRMHELVAEQELATLRETVLRAGWGANIRQQLALILGRQ